MSKLNTSSPMQQNEKSTFLIQVQFRQNATWHGSLQWVEKNKINKFHSALEMLSFINEALEETDTEPTPAEWQQDEDKSL